MLKYQQLSLVQRESQKKLLTLDSSGKVLELLGLSLPGSLLLIGLLQLQTVLGNADKLLVLVLLELSGGVLINGVNHEEDFEVFLLEDLEEGRVANLGEGFSGEVVDVLLLFGHSGNVICGRERKSDPLSKTLRKKADQRTLEGGHLLSGLGGVESEELSELGSVLSILVDTELDVLSESLVELGEAG